MGKPLTVILAWLLLGAAPGPFLGYPGGAKIVLSPFTHVIVIEQENQTVDHLFNGITGINTTTSYTTSTGSTGTLTDQGGIANNSDNGHHHNAFMFACNVGYFTIGGNPGNGDVVTITINGHAVNHTVIGTPSQTSLANNMIAAINADSTDSAIVTADDSNTNNNPTAIVYPNNPSLSYTMTASVTTSGGTTTIYAAPAVGGACNNRAFDLEPCNAGSCAAGSMFTYVDSSYTTHYNNAWQLNGTFADHNFMPLQGPSTPAHTIIYAGASNVATSTNFALASNPVNGDAGWENTGNATAIQIATNYPGKIWDVGSIHGVSPVGVDLPSILTQLDANGLSWKVYQSTQNPVGILALWDGVSQIKDKCGAVGGQCKSSDYVNKVIGGGAPDTAIIADINGGTLPKVSWVIPTVANSDHPGVGLTTNNGPSYVAGIINACGAVTSCWQHTAIFITWDDWGGYFDHVPPPSSGNVNWYYGFRVPLIAVSAYMKNVGTVDSTVRNSTSILHFIEDTFGLGQISTVSIERSTDDLFTLFNFTASPASYNTI